MNVPSWLNTDLFEASLRKYYKSYVKILKLNCKSAIPIGENYTTNVFRVKITFVRNEQLEDEEITSLIIKCVREGIVEALAGDMNLFPKEIDMFCNVLPKMNSICGIQRAFSANCINASMKPYPFIMVEDMCPKGFKVHKRQMGLDIEHTRMALKTMATFHAASIVMHEKTSLIQNNDMYNEGLYTNKESVNGWLKLAFASFIEAIENSKDFALYYEKLKKLCANCDIIERCQKSWKREEGQFSVLNHGDMWVNNMMFSYQPSGKVNGCKLIDLQLTIYTSPAIDLHYFLATSLSIDIIQDVNYLLDFYYAHLLLELIKLSYDLDTVPSRKEFKKDFKERAIYGLTAMATVLPIVKAESRDDASLDDLMKDDTKDGFRYHCYNNKVYKSTILHLLPYYDKLGVFT